MKNKDTLLLEATYMDMVKKQNPDYDIDKVKAKWRDHDEDDPAAHAEYLKGWDDELDRLRDFTPSVDVGDWLSFKTWNEEPTIGQITRLSYAQGKHGWAGDKHPDRPPVWEIAVYTNYPTNIVRPSKKDVVHDGKIYVKGGGTFFPVAAEGNLFKKIDTPKPYTGRRS